jgi:rubrerythrin
LYGKFTRKKPEPGFPRSLLSTGTPDDTMEGGVLVAEAISWVKGKAAADILEFAMALEINSYDLYIKMQRVVADEKSKEVFAALSGEEKKHLDRFSDLLDKKI